MLVTALFSMSGCKSDPPDSWSVSSPDGNVVVKLRQDQQNGQIYYAVSKKADNGFATVIEDSPLGIVLKEGDFTAGLRFLSADSSVIDESYELVSGKRLNNRNHARRLAVLFRNASEKNIAIEFLAYNDGAAFRYSFPDKGDSITVMEEKSSFRFGEGKKWAQPYDLVTQWTPAYEKYYLNGVDIGSASPNPGGWCFPALFQTANSWVLLSEAGPFGEGFGSHFMNADSAGTYVIRGPEKEEAYGRETAGSFALPWSSPWRLIMLGSSVAEVVESNLIYHVSPERMNVDFSWVKPGKSSWSWWSDTGSPREYKTLQKFVDFTAEMGWPYFLVDANWNEMKGGTLEQLASYSNSKGVGLLVWYNSGGPHNEVTEQPRDKMHESESRKKEMAWLQKIGVKGLKVDFFQTDKAFAMEQYQGILRDAAAHNLVVNFHGCTIPRGWRKQWPNLLSMESARGAETYIFGKDFPEKAPLHNVHLVFTRNIIGPMDYTPVTFSDNKFAHVTSNGHELALSVVFETGVLHLADAVESYRKMPVYVTAFLKDLPVVWEETKLLGGAPDKDALIARKNGGNWYVGYINGETTSKEVAVDFSFLPEGTYQGTIINDSGKGREFSMKTVELTSKSRETIPSIGNGGFVISLKAQ